MKNTPYPTHMEYIQDSAQTRNGWTTIHWVYTIEVRENQEKHVIDKTFFATKQQADTYIKENAECLSPV